MYPSPPLWILQTVIQPRCYKPARLEWTFDGWDGYTTDRKNMILEDMRAEAAEVFECSPDRVELHWDDTKNNTIHAHES
jgi:hypothetical protein